MVTVFMSVSATRHPETQISTLEPSWTLPPSFSTHNPLLSLFTSVGAKKKQYFPPHLLSSIWASKLTDAD